MEKIYENPKYTPFRIQLKECEKNGNLIKEEKCFMCGHELLLCKKYGGQCKSSKCIHERTKED